MTLRDVLERIYDALGDTIDGPRRITRARATSLVNEGCRVFRSRAEEIWMRYDQAVAQGLSVYTLPAGVFRVKRIAFDDWTLDPATVVELSSIDERWRTAPGDPRRWTSDDVAWNQWRFWPVPGRTTTELVSMSSEKGIVTRIRESSGANYTPVADPLVPGWDPERGLTALIGGMTAIGDRGTITLVEAAGVNQATVWGVETPEAIQSDNQELEIKDCFYQAPVFYALWHIFDQEGDNHNGFLARYYEGRFEAEIEQAIDLVNNPLPYRIHVIGEGHAKSVHDESQTSWPDVVDFGSGPAFIGWPRRAWE